MADKLASMNKGIPVIRLNYRYPARNKYCVAAAGLADARDRGQDVEVLVLAAFVRRVWR